MYDLAAFPQGLPDLSESDSAKVREGNTLATFSVSIMSICRLHQIPATLENPARSYMFDLPEFVRFAAHAGVVTALTEFCMYGEPWRKATRLLGVHICLERLGHFRCLHKARGTCARTGLPHVILTGKDDLQRFRTTVAQAYPRKFCKTLAACFNDAAVNHTAYCIWDKFR